MNEQIFVGKCGAIIANNKTMQGYYLVEWLFQPYII